jgi:adenosine deaminase
LPTIPEPALAAGFVLLFEQCAELLDLLIYDDMTAAESFIGAGFDTYESIGDIQGSTLLQCEPCLRAACRILIRKAREHKLRYLELRCSPLNYIRGGMNGDLVARIVAEELEKGGIDHGLIFIASRHGTMSRVYKHVELAESLMGMDKSRFPALVGFDLAGSERSRSAALMREAFLPLMERCLHLTIHAGEGEDVRNIWEAVYHLSAERIGHGLTLKGNDTLLQRFRDRSIAIEMCPSSNVQIVGFRDNHLPATHDRPIYPLKEYLDRGLRVTVNTDNPGISRTDFSLELHRAARLTPGGLSPWDILRLVRNGFKAAFCDRGKKQKLLEEAERLVIEAIPGAETLAR